MNLSRSCLLPFLAAAFLGSGVRAASADPAKYRLNGGTSAVGNATRTEKQMTLTAGDFTLAVGGGQSMDGKMTISTDAVETSKVTAADGGKATTIEVFNEKDATSQKLSLAGQEIPNKETSPMQGTTVVRRRTGDTWTDTLKEGTPTAKQKKRLHTNRPDDGELLYPAGEIAVGDTWTVPSSSLQRLFGDDVESVTGDARCKLLRVETLDGQPCAVVQIDMDATGTGMDDNNQKMKMGLNVHGTVYRSLQRPVDLKTDMQGTLKIQGNVAVGGAAADLSVSGPITISEKTTLTP